MGRVATRAALPVIVSPRCTALHLAGSRPPERCRLVSRPRFVAEVAAAAVVRAVHCPLPAEFVRAAPRLMHTADPRRARSRTDRSALRIRELLEAHDRTGPDIC